MRESGARVRTIRTTRDDVDRAYGIVTGMAATPDEALVKLRSNAEALAESLEPRKLAKERELVESYQPFEESVPGAIGPFEVVDVHLTAGVMESGGSGWLAYGTLAKKERA